MFQPKIERFTLSKEDRHAPGKKIAINLNQVLSVVADDEGGSYVSLPGVTYRINEPPPVLLTKMR